MVLFGLLCCVQPDVIFFAVLSLVCRVLVSLYLNFVHFSGLLFSLVCCDVRVCIILWDDVCVISYNCVFSDLMYWNMLSSMIYY